MRCPTCTAETDERFRFCGRCGARLVRPAPLPTASSAEPPDHEIPAAGAAALREAIESEQGTGTVAGDDAGDPETPRRVRRRLAVPGLILVVVAATVVAVTRSPAPVPDPVAVDAGRTGHLEVSLPSYIDEVRWEQRLEEPAPLPVSTPTLKGDTAVVVVPGAVTAIDRSSGRTRWRVEVPATGVAAPEIQRDVVVVVARDEVLGLDLDTGGLRWRHPVPGAGANAATVADNVVLVVTSAGAVHALWLGDGHRLWEVKGRDLPGEDVYDLVGRPVATGGIAYVRGRAVTGTGAVLLALRVLNGDLVGRYEAPLQDLAVAGDVLVAVGTGGARGIALDLRRTRWNVSVALDESPVSLLAATRSRVVFATARRHLVVDPTTGEVVAVHREGPMLLGDQGVAASSRLAYVATQGQTVAVLDTLDGRVVAESTALGEAVRPPASGQLTGVAAVADGRVVGIGPGGEVRWQTQVVAPTSCPVAAGGDLVVFSGDMLTARSLATGEQRWRHAPEVPVVGPVTVVDDVVQAVDTSGRLLTLDASTGLRTGVAVAGSGALSPVAVADGASFVAGRLPGAGATGYVRRVDATSGSTQWLAYTGGPVRHAPSVGSGLVVVASASEVQGFDLVTGALRWAAPVDAPVTAPPAVVGDRVVVSTSQAVLTLDLVGTVQWQARFDAPLDRAAVVTDDLVVVRRGIDRLQALDLDTGERRWGSRLGVPMTSPPVASRDQIVVGTLVGLAVLDLRDGSHVQTVPRPSAVAARPLLTAAGPVVCQGDGTVVALR